MTRLLQALFFFLVVRPLIMIVIGLNIHGKEGLPQEGPAIIAANHNSHLDTLTLMSLWSLTKLHHVRPIAAADYFLRNSVLAWFSLNIMHVIPIDRQRKDRSKDPLDELAAALDRNQILILFPEGSRGAPEQLSRFKTGISRLIERRPEAPIIPVFMHGLGKSLPRGDFLLVPFFGDVLIGDRLYWQGSVEATMAAYQTAMNKLSTQIETPEWE